MKNLIIILAVIILIAAIGGLGYKFLASDKEMDSNQKGTNEVANDLKKQTGVNEGDEEESFFGSIKDLLARGKSLKCTYDLEADEENGDGEGTGVIYVAGNKVRSDIEFYDADEDKTVEIDSIIDDEWIYTWNNFMSKGIKMKAEEANEGEGFDVREDFENLQKELDYNCRPWIKDSSKFDLPSGVDFEDMNETMSGFQGAMQNFDPEKFEEDNTEVLESLCNLCEMAPDEESKASCLSSAGCQ